MRTVVFIGLSLIAQGVMAIAIAQGGEPANADPRFGVGLGMVLLFSIVMDIIDFARGKSDS